MARARVPRAPGVTGARGSLSARGGAANPSESAKLTRGAGFRVTVTPASSGRVARGRVSLPTSESVGAAAVTGRWHRRAGPRAAAADRDHDARARRGTECWTPPVTD